MGKIYKIKDPKTGKAKYPVTVGDAIVIDGKTLTRRLDEIPDKVSELENDAMYVSNKPLLSVTHDYVYPKTNAINSCNYATFNIKQLKPYEPVYVRVRCYSYADRTKEGQTAWTETNVQYMKGWEEVELWLIRTNGAYYIQKGGMYSTSYRPFQHMTLHRPANDDLGWVLGIRFRDAYNYNSTSAYGRSVRVDLVEIHGGTATAYAANTKLGDVPGMDYYLSLTSDTAGARKNYIGETNITFQIGQYHSGDQNNYDRRVANGWRIQLGPSHRINAGIFGLDANGRAIPVSYRGTGSTTGIYSVADGTRIFNTDVGFDTTKGLFYAGSSYGVNSFINGPYVSITGIDGRYWDNVVAAASANTLGYTDAKPIFLRGVIMSDGLFYLRPLTVKYNNIDYYKAIVQELPTRAEFDEDGNPYAYWFVGYPYYNSSYPLSLNAHNLEETNPVYIFSEGQVKEYRAVAYESMGKMPEHNLAWGTRSVHQDSVISPIDTILLENLHANRLSGLGKECIDVEFSTDGGTTWNDYEASENQIRRITTTEDSLSVGKKVGADATSSDMLRVTLHAYKDDDMSVGAKVYCSLVAKLGLRFSTNGAVNCKVLIEGKPQNANFPNVDWQTVWDWDVINGWTGWNLYPLNVGFGGYANQTSSNRYAVLRITIKMERPKTTTYKCNASLIAIQMYGPSYAITPSNMAKNGHVYSFDEYFNTVFPAKVTASSFVRSGGTSSQFLKADGSVDSTKYLTASDISGKVDKVSGKGLSTNDYTTDEKNKLAGIAAGAEVNVNADWNATSGDAQILNKPTHLSGDIPTSEKGTANGVATLGSDGKVPSSQLPSYVDDVLEYSGKANFPKTGESGKIYIDTATNLTYRWSGSAYSEISQSLALGETSSTAYAGDKGKANATAIAGLKTSKQDTISDLATIRSGAAKGATAVQPAAISDMETRTHATATYQPLGDYPEIEDLPDYEGHEGSMAVGSFTGGLGERGPVTADDVTFNAAAASKPGSVGAELRDLSRKISRIETIEETTSDVQKGYVLKVDGTSVNLNSRTTSGYIEVGDGIEFDCYSPNNSTLYCAYVTFDANKGNPTPVSFAGNTINHVKLEPQEGVKYVRFMIASTTNAINYLRIVKTGIESDVRDLDRKVTNIENKFKVVEELPGNPTEGTIYFVVEPSAQALSLASEEPIDTPIDEPTEEEND